MTISKTPYPPIRQTTAAEQSAPPGNADEVLYINTMPKRSVYPIVHTLAFGATDTTKSFILETYALLHSAILTLPAGAGGTATLTIADQNGKTVYSQTGITMGQDNIFNDAEFAVPLSGLSTITVTLTNPLGGSGGNIVVSLKLKGGPEW